MTLMLLDIILVLCNLSVSNASPHKRDNRTTTFTIPQQANPNFMRNASATHFADLARYNVTINSTYAAALSSSRAAAGGQTGSTSALALAFESEYVCQVTVGGQNLYLDFDTGSSDLWVFSTFTVGIEQVGHQLYNPALSSTATQMPGETWEISYADGSGCGGIVFKDDVSIGASTSEGQGVEVALYVSPEFAADYFSNGLVGLAFSSLNTASPVQQLTYFENILPTLEEPLFTANLKHGEPGNYNFGYIDPTEYSGSIAWTPVTTPYGYYAYWQLDLSGYQISSEPYIEIPINGIADTGTTLLYLPIDVVTAYYAAVTGSVFDEDQAAWLFPCSATLPDFIFGIADYRGVVPGDYMNYAPVDDVWCYGGIQPDTGLPFSIFGDILLKAQFVVFDHSGPRLGFANKL